MSTTDGMLKKIEIGIPLSKQLEGVLIIAHGSRNLAWVRMVESVVQKAQLPYPVEMGFLELVVGKSIPEAIRRLEDKGVKQAFVVPLFVSSGSTHIDEIQYALGIRPVPTLKTELERIPTSLHFHWCPPFDDHPLVADILVDRIEEGFRRSEIKGVQKREMEWNRVYFPPLPVEQTAVILVGHGAEYDGFLELWEKMMESLTITVKNRLGVSYVSYGFLRPATLRTAVEIASNKAKYVFVQPIFLSKGYFTEVVIPQKLEGLTYHYYGCTYLPHPNISIWLRNSIGLHTYLVDH